MHYLLARITQINYRHYLVGGLVLCVMAGFGWIKHASAQAAYSVDVTTNTVSGNSVTIQWSAPSNRPIGTGWVGIYTPGAADEQYYRWAYVSSGTGGTVTISYVEPGTYQFRLFTGSQYERVASGGTFTVLGGQGQGGAGNNNGTGGNSNSEGNTSGSYSLSLSATSIAPGGRVTVTINTPASANRNRDWIGLYRVGTSNESYIDWQYVDDDDSSAATVIIDNAGQYEFRYFRNDSYADVATSPVVTVTTTSGGSNQCSLSTVAGVTNYPPRSGPVVAFGDSLTAGVGATAGQDYVSQLERLTGVSIVNAGVSGDTTRTALARLESDVLARDPATVIVWIGGNDILSHYYDRVVRGLESQTVREVVRQAFERLGSNLANAPVIMPNETFENLETIVRRIHADGAVVILVGFSGEPFNTNLDSRFRAVAEATGAIYVPDVLDGVIGRPSLMSDLIHPNDEGYRIVAGRINQQLLCVVR